MWCGTGPDDESRKRPKRQRGRGLVHRIDQPCIVLDCAGDLFHEQEIAGMHAGFRIRVQRRLDGEAVGHPCIDAVALRQASRAPQIPPRAIPVPLRAPLPLRAPAAPASPRQRRAAPALRAPKNHPRSPPAQRVPRAPPVRCSSLCVCTAASDSDIAMTSYQSICVRVYSRMALFFWPNRGRALKFAAALPPYPQPPPLARQNP